MPVVVCDCPKSFITNDSATDSIRISLMKKKYLSYTLLLNVKWIFLPTEKLGL